MIPINNQYPVSSAIYRIMAKGDAEYARFLHEQGYGKGFKFFTFSALSCPFTVEGDRLRLHKNELSFFVSFHLPEASQHFIKGLFQSERLTIADRKSKAEFQIASVEAMPNPLKDYGENQLASLDLRPLSPVVAGIKNEKGNYDFLEPQDERFAQSLLYNWREKIRSCYDEGTAREAVLTAAVSLLKNPPKSRLITIKADTPEQTKIRGWVNFGLNVTAERRFLELLLNCGAGLYNAMGMGCMGLVR